MTLACHSPKGLQQSSLQTQQLAPGVWLHTSYIHLMGYGPFPCNGLVYAHQGEAIVLETPINDSVSVELINWIENELECDVVGVIAHHFHEDCLGGLKAFHDRGVPSYGLNKTLELALEDSIEVPQIGFEEMLTLQVGGEPIKTQFFGAGHTADNVVTYIPSTKVLFGGCLVKAVDANKGYLGDADTLQWSNTARQLQLEFSNVELVIPGHGKPGGLELLSYTEQLFSQ